MCPEYLSTHIPVMKGRKLAGDLDKNEFSSKPR